MHRLHRHPEYEQGYHDGYHAGITDGLVGASDVVRKSLTPVVLTAPDTVVAAAKRDLAEKVWAILKHEADYYDGMRLTEHGRGGKQKLRQVTEAIECLFSQSGIELTTTQQQEG
jgi:hypothetical protein